MTGGEAIAEDVETGDLTLLRPAYPGLVRAAQRRGIRFPNPLGPSMRAWRYEFSSISCMPAVVRAIAPTEEEANRLATLALREAGKSIGFMSLCAFLPWVPMAMAGVWLGETVTGSSTVGVISAIILVLIGMFCSFGVCATRDIARDGAWPVILRNAMVELRQRRVDVPKEIEAMVGAVVRAGAEADLVVLRALGPCDGLAMDRLAYSLHEGKSDVRSISMDGETSELVDRVTGALEAALPVSSTGELRLSVTGRRKS